VVLAAVFAANVAAVSDPCAGRGTSLFVQAKRRVIWLCENGQRTDGMRVAIGPGGLDKRVEGDAKVPLGEYPLSSPVASKDYHLFILVGYPTAAQRKAGYTGGAVGVHGPMRGYSGPQSTDRDWTLGCIAVGTDREIERIAQWMKDKHVTRIVIQPE
jgi:murein L,D-transpeptidase YafK